MEIIISNEPEELEVPQEYIDNIRTAIETVGRLYGVEDSEVSVTLTDNEHIHVINRKYRGVDRPTDVISLPSTKVRSRKSWAEVPSICSGI